MIPDYELDYIVREMGLDDEGRAVLGRLIKTQDEIHDLQESINALLPKRRDDVFRLQRLCGVSNYRLAHILHVSQTTMGNITRGEGSVKITEDPSDETEDATGEDSSVAN